MTTKYLTTEKYRGINGYNFSPSNNQHYTNKTNNDE